MPASCRLLIALTLPSRFRARRSALELRLGRRNWGYRSTAFKRSNSLSGVSGNELPDGAQPIAPGHAGHQFGNFVPQLGDGRALLLGEVIDRHGRRRDIAFQRFRPTALLAPAETAKRPSGRCCANTSSAKAMHALEFPRAPLGRRRDRWPVRRERNVAGARANARRREPYSRRYVSILRRAGRP